MFTFLGKHKILMLFFCVLLLIMIFVFIRAQFFLNNWCPSCNEFLIFYTPKGYYDPLLTKAITVKKGKISFSFSIDKYGEYGIGLKNLNGTEGAFHFSKDISYKTFCESVKSKEGSKFNLPVGYSLGTKKIFFNEAVLWRINGFDESESAREDRKRRLFIYDYIPLKSVAAFDIGNWISGSFDDDIGRQYDCTIEFLMDEADFFEADLVVRRRSPH